MKLYTCSTARQRLADVLEDASRDAQVHAATMVAFMRSPVSASVPFRNVTGHSASGVSSSELLGLAREDGFKRGVRVPFGALAGANDGVGSLVVAELVN